jgi:hypothetical protein
VLPAANGIGILWGHLGRRICGCLFVALLGARGLALFVYIVPTATRALCL